jgi:hypothetical protein
MRVAQTVSLAVEIDVCQHPGPDDTHTRGEIFALNGRFCFLMIGTANNDPEIAEKSV